MIDTGVMSYWSRFRSIEDKPIDKHDIYMWSLSLHRLKKVFSKTVLVTDGVGSDILCSELKLPFDKVIINLDNLVEPKLEWIWALGKVKAYNSVSAPFCHIDADVILGKPFHQRILTSDAFVQNHEKFYASPKDKTLGYNIYWYREIFKNLPNSIRECLYEEEHSGLNLGVFGGNDLSFINSYVNTVFNIVESNLDSLRKLTNPDGAVMSFFLEQYTFAALAKSYSYPVEEIISYLPWGFQRRKDYWHLCGSRKTLPKNRDRIKYLLKEENPEMYERCEKAVRNLKLDV